MMVSDEMPSHSDLSDHFKLIVAEVSVSIDPIAVITRITSHLEAFAEIIERPVAVGQHVDRRVPRFPLCLADLASLGQWPDRMGHVGWGVRVGLNSAKAPIVCDVEPPDQCLRQQ